MPCLLNWQCFHTALQALDDTSMACFRMYGPGQHVPGWPGWQRLALGMALAGQHAWWSSYFMTGSVIWKVCGSFLRLKR